MTISDWVKHLLSVVAWGMLVVAALAWLVLYRADDFWLGTLLGFGPRWALLIPWMFLILTSMKWYRRVLVPLGLAGVILVGPVLGLCVPWRPWGDGGSEGFSVKVLTLNTENGGGASRLPELITRQQPDIVTLQEWPRYQPLPDCLSEQRGWYCVRQTTIVLASRWPIVGSEFLISPNSRWSRPIGVRAQIDTPAGAITAYCVHLLSPRDGLGAVLGSRLAGLDELRENARQRGIDASALSRWVKEGSRPRLIAGDFNLLPESVIYRREFSSWQNAFSVAGSGWGRTKYTRWHGVRIDHVLADDHWRVTECQVLADAGSDHRPVVAELVLAAG